MFENIDSKKPHNCWSRQTIPDWNGRKVVRGSLANESRGVLKKWHPRGAGVAQSVKRPTSAQVTISRSVSSSPASGSVLTAQSLEPVSDSVSPSLSAPPPVHVLSLSVPKINVEKKNLNSKNKH